MQLKQWKIIEVGKKHLINTQVFTQLNRCTSPKKASIVSYHTAVIVS